MRICMEKLVQVDGKVRTDIKFPAGFMGMYTTPGFLSCKLVCLLACMHPPMTGDGLRKHLFAHLVRADVVSIPRSGDNFRLLYDVKGRFRLVKVGDDEAKVRLLVNDMGAQARAPTTCVLTFLCRRVLVSLSTPVQAVPCDQAGVHDQEHPLHCDPRRPHHSLPGPRGTRSGHCARGHCLGQDH